MKQDALKQSEIHGDLDYVNWRNSFIQDAVRFANNKMRKHKGLPFINKKSPHKECFDFNHCLWTEYFCAEMNKLTSKKER